LQLKEYATKAARVLREEGALALMRKISNRLRVINSGMQSDHQETHDSVAVLFVNGCDASVPHPARYRVHHQMEQLALWGYDADEVFYGSLRPEDIDRADMAILFRCPLTTAVEQMIERAHVQGKRVLFDIDDLVIHTKYTDDLPVVQAMSTDEKAVFDDGVMRNGRTLALCDGAIVSTERLKTELQKVAPSVFVNRNVASMEMLACSQAALANVAPSNGNEVRIGYFSGSMTHNRDFAQIIPALTAVMEANPQVILMVCGDLAIPDELQRFSHRIRSAQKVDWRELPQVIASVDICIAPIESTLFNEAKSENKWTEASLVKVPLVASDVGAFHDMIEHGKTGFLCRSSEEWERTLIALAGDASLRARIGQAAFERCISDCLTATTGYKLVGKLFGARCRIDDIVPKDEAARKIWMDGYLGDVYDIEQFPAVSADPWNQVSLADRIAHIERAGMTGQRIALFVYERNCGDSATFRYFGYNTVQRLASSRTCSSQYFFVDELDSIKKFVPQTECIVIVRGRFRPEFVELARTAFECKVPISYAIDDNALGSLMTPRVVGAMVQDQSSTFEIGFWTGVTYRFEMASQLADCFIASSPFFADILHERYGKPAFFIHPSLNDEQVEISDRIREARCLSNEDHGKLFTLGYFSGTASHQEDFSLIERAVIDHLNANEDSRLLIVGCFQLSDALYELLLRGRVRVLPKVDYATLQLLQASVDVVLAPLVLDEFTHCKGALKVFEAGVVGTPACASPSFCYSEAIEEGLSGFLCSSDVAWEEALQKLHDDMVLCGEMGEKAHGIALERYHGQATLEEIELALDQVASVPVESKDAALLKILDTSDTFANIEDWDDQFEVNPLFALERIYSTECK